MLLDLQIQAQEDTLREKKNATEANQELKIVSNLGLPSLTPSNSMEGVWKIAQNNRRL